MLEIKQPHWRWSAYYNGLNSGGTATTLYRGMFVKISGKATGNYGPTATAGGPKYASSGDLLMTAARAADTETGPVFPVGYHITKEDGSDLDNDTLASGFEIVYYQGGEYETDQYGVVTGGTFGVYLFLDNNSKLTTSSSGAAVAIWVDQSSTFDSNYSATGMLWFRLL